MGLDLQDRNRVDAVDEDERVNEVTVQQKAQEFTTRAGPRMMSLERKRKFQECQDSSSGPGRKGEEYP